ncbi:MAG: septum formation inhibitor Maf [Synergistaceae bacterium]|nr:septum formation inhibitor Maf [Synergistaceae bacterium]
MQEDLKIYLASSSPRRKFLLHELGLNFEIIKPEVDEKILPDEKPEDLCARLAKIKCEAAARELKINNALIIAADTIVVIDNKILGKPKDFDNALEMLSLLQGREHEVLTGIALSFNNKLISSFERTRVKFRALTHAQIEAYINSGECMDKAGAYAIQGKGSLLIESIHGDYFNVVGLPVCLMGELLEQNFNFKLEDLLNLNHE